MKALFAVGAAFALFVAAPALAADNDPNAATGKPTSSSNPASNSEAKSMGTSSGASMGTSGASKELPGASDSKKNDSSLDTNGNKPKQ